MRVLINRTDAIGDNLLTMPLARAIKEHFPECQIGIITSPRCEDIYKAHKDIDKVFLYDKGASFLKNLKRSFSIFNSFKPDTYFFVGGSHIPSLVAFLKKTNFRGGLKSKWQTFLFLSKGVRQKRSIVSMHESEYNLELLRPLIQHIQEAPFYPPSIHLEANEVEESLDLFWDDSQKDANKELFFIHPGMTGHTLNWSSRNYGRLITRLEKRYPERFLYVISHTPSDERFLTGLREQIQSFDENKVYFFDGSKRGLRHYMAVLSTAKLFLGPSTGTTHIANILGVKTVGIYSPIKVQSSMRWRPFFNSRDSLRVVTPDVVCGEQFKCAGESCPYFECMAKIEVDDIIKQINELLEHS
ncbi:glycosyltransferase family 9 protein [Halobacteriovorax sp. GB3]|uniref:glycosyltransferase family 9 protein n=1 Tax=Halobacteriovorax sp. GB3 TaxID=2719615 RepID=UPI00235FB4E9|nr:glycosyltransferase family 9 protein [Halobacteriovorax sp. GB3]MDD0852384.1 glycosyltransferase family 9 protein [Halobacteriovorax sp. GB3]